MQSNKLPSKQKVLFEPAKNTPLMLNCVCCGERQPHEECGTAKYALCTVCGSMNKRRVYNANV